jgi:hypothetical protein
VRDQRWRHRVTWEKRSHNRGPVYTKLLKLMNFPPCMM